MNVLMSGSSGLIGTALTARLEAEGHSVVRLARPYSISIDASRLQNVDAVVNLAGASIARWPWTSAHRRAVLESRVSSTSLLAETASALPQKPRVFVSASGVGYYGDRGDEVLRETSAGGSGFLAGVCRAWESAAAPAADAGIRLVTLRIGMVLSGAGGALPVMARPFRFGFGGVLGNGRQYMSWIAIEDLVRAIVHAIGREDLSGPVNGVSPNPATNAEFTAALGRVLHRPTPFPVPAFALRALLGEMADELLLSSQRTEPARLQASGFSYRHPNLEEALRTALA